MEVGNLILVVGYNSVCILEYKEVRNLGYHIFK